MMARSSFGRLARTVFIRSRYLVTVRTFVWNWCLSVAIQQASAVPGAGRNTLECIGWRSVAMIDYKVNSSSRCYLGVESDLSGELLMIKRFVSLLVVSFASSYSQQSQPTGAAAAPAARPASFATVTALTRAVLDSKSCVSGKEFRIS